MVTERPKMDMNDVVSSRITLMLTLISRAVPWQREFILGSVRHHYTNESTLNTYLEIFVSPRLWRMLVRRKYILLI